MRRLMLLGSIQGPMSLSCVKLIIDLMYFASGLEFLRCEITILYQMHLTWFELKRRVNHTSMFLLTCSLFSLYFPRFG